MTDEFSKRKQELEKRRDELVHRLNRIRLDYGRGLPSDSEDQAQELENADVLNEISRVTAEELATIEAAIRRIEETLARQ